MEKEASSFPVFTPLDWATGKEEKVFVQKTKEA